MNGQTKGIITAALIALVVMAMVHRIEPLRNVVIGA